MIPCEDRGIEEGEERGVVERKKKEGGGGGGGGGVEEVDRVDGTALPIGDECWGSFAYSVGPKGLSHSLTEWK